MKGSPNVVTVIILVLAGAIAFGLGYGLEAAPWLVGLVVVAGVLASFSPRVIREWERGVLLRLGKIQRVLDPGVAWVIPGIDQVTSVVDMRIRSTSFSRCSPRKTGSVLYLLNTRSSCTSQWPDASCTSWRGISGRANRAPCSAASPSCSADFSRPTFFM